VRKLLAPIVIAFIKLCKLKYYIQAGIHLPEEKALLTFLTTKESSYLKEVGWLKAIVADKPIDNEGKPLPWLPYPFIAFIEERLNKNLIMFEYGMGNSTLYFANYIQKLVSVEHDKEWYEIVNKNSFSNAELLYEEYKPDSSYCRKITERNEVFDIVLVDGRDRVNCVTHAVDKLSNTGVIILDNSDREKYAPAFEFLADKGFKNISFKGLASAHYMTSQTTVFYKENNCLNI